MIARRRSISSGGGLYSFNQSLINVSMPVCASMRRASQSVPFCCALRYSPMSKCSPCGSAKRTASGRGQICTGLNARLRKSFQLESIEKPANAALICLARSSTPNCGKRISPHRVKIVSRCLRNFCVSDCACCCRTHCCCACGCAALSSKSNPNRASAIPRSFFGSVNGSFPQSSGRAYCLLATTIPASTSAAPRRECR